MNGMNLTEALRHRDQNSVSSVISVRESHPTAKRIEDQGIDAILTS